MFCISSLVLNLLSTQVTLTGHEGKYKNYMGVYNLSSERANNAVLFVKDVGGGVKRYLFRASDTGMWLVTNDESNIAKNKGYIKSSKAADLPSSAGVMWQCYDGKNWPDDPNLRCTAVRPPHDMSSRTHERLGC